MPNFRVMPNFILGRFSDLGNKILSTPNEDIEYFKQRVKKYPNSVLVTLDSDSQLKYDEKAVAGAKLYYQEGLSDLQHRLEEVIRKRQSLPSGSNFFRKLSGQRGQILAAERSLDEARRQLEERIGKTKETLGQLENLPELPKYVFNPKAKHRASQEKISRSEKLSIIKSKATQVL